MHSRNMYTQDSLIIKGLWTFGTLKGAFIFMDSINMLVKMAFMPIRFPTNVTFIGFLSFMHSGNMYIQVSIIIKGL